MSKTQQGEYKAPQLNLMTADELADCSRRARENAQKLLDLADAIDAKLLADSGKKPQTPRTDYSRVGQTQLLARNLRLAREARHDYFDEFLFEDPAWNILLALYEIDAVEPSWHQTKKICSFARIPATTALRWISTLVDAGLLERGETDDDQRASLLRLSNSGLKAVYAFLDHAITIFQEEVSPIYPSLATAPLDSRA